MFGGFPKNYSTRPVIPNVAPNEGGEGNGSSGQEAYRYTKIGKGYYVSNRGDSKRFSPLVGDFLTEKDAERFINRQVKIFCTRLNPTEEQLVQYASKYKIIKSESE